MEPITMILLAIITVISGVVGGMIGGSYLIFIPALLFLGFDILYILGITKVAAIGQNLSFINYWKNGKVSMKSSWPFGVIIFIGSIIGSIIVISLDKGLLQNIIVVLMILVAIFILVNKDLGMNSIKTKIKKKHIIIGAILFFILGIYVGFLATASSIFFIMILTLLFKKDLVESVGNARFIDLFGSIAGVIVFTSKGLIDYSIAIPIGIIYFGGAWIGSHITLKNGNSLVRYLLVIIAIAFAIKLLFF